MGQAAYLSKHHNTSYQISFYVSVPGMFLAFSLHTTVYICKFSGTGNSLEEQIKYCF